jgi:hypothetical protein
MRALLVFDRMGHGRNRAKLASHSSVQLAHEAKCRQCGLTATLNTGMYTCPTYRYSSKRTH